MEILDPFVHDLLARPLPPAFDFFPDADAANTEAAIRQLDDYFRAIGVLPPLPSTPDHATVWSSVDDDVDLQSTHQPYAAVDVHVQLHPAAPAPTASSSYDDGAAAMDDAYDSDIDASLRAQEESHANERPSPDYLAATATHPLARAALVAWMSDFAAHFGFGAAALHRAVSYADRFLSSSKAATASVVVSDDYQLRLLGAAAVYTAAKLEDSATSRRANAADIAACCGFAASREVLDAERALLQALGYRGLGGPTPHTFVEHFTRRKREEDSSLRRAAHVLADSSLLDHRCLGLRASAVAAAAILLSRMSMEPSPHDVEQVRRWSGELEEVTGYKPVDMYEGVYCMYKMMSEDPGFEISPLLFADYSSLHEEAVRIIRA